MRLIFLFFLVFSIGCSYADDSNSEYSPKSTKLMGWEKSTKNGAAYWLSDDAQVLNFTCFEERGLLHFTSSGHTLYEQQQIALHSNIVVPLTVRTNSGIIETEMKGGENTLPFAMFSPSEEALQPLFVGHGHFIVKINDQHVFKLPISPILSDAIKPCREQTR